VTRSIVKVWALVTGRVPDIGPQDRTLAEPTEAILGRYCLDFRPALVSGHYEPFGEGGVPVRSWSAVAGYAIACFQRLGDTGDASWEGRFLSAARFLLTSAEPCSAGGVAWHATFDGGPLKKGPVKLGWISALYQGQAMSVLVRAHLLTGDREFLRVASEAWRMLSVPVDQGGLAARFLPTNDYCWEEIPSQPASRILNGWILAIWGLLDLAAVAPSPEIWQACATGLESLRRHLPDYDTGWWSTYDHPMGKPPRLASVTYHYEHIWMLRALAERTGIDDFAHWAERWDDNAGRVSNRLRALVGKAGQRLAHGY